MATGYTAGGQDVYTPSISESGGSGTSGGVTMTEVLEKLYPVGSVILRYDTEDPNEYLGVGTWRRESSDRFLTLASSSPSFGSGSGVTLTEENLPAHTHDITIESAGSHTHTATVESAGEHTHTASSASAGAHTHTITVDSAGAHEHSLTLKWTSSRGQEGSDIGQVNTSGTETSEGNWGTAESAGSHTHTASSESAGAHTHTITNEDAGAHTHTVTNASAGSHTHTATASETGSGEAFSVTIQDVDRIMLVLWRRTE